MLRFGRHFLQYAALPKIFPKPLPLPNAVLPIGSGGIAQVCVERRRETFLPKL
jgi:hypothetical protein